MITVIKSHFSFNAYSIYIIDGGTNRIQNGIINKQNSLAL